MTTLVFAPHADDEVLGLGGTIARLARSGEDVILAVLTGSGEGDHPLWPNTLWNEIRSECRSSSQILGISEIIFKDLPAACLDAIPSWRTNQVVSDILETIKPTEVYVPFYYDLHKDHSAVAYGVHVAARPYLSSARFVRRILAYETLSETNVVPPYSSFNFQPNVFVNIEDTIALKLDAMKAYKSQLQPNGFPRSLDAIRALATFRGSNIGVSAAEAFMLMGEYIR